MSTPRSEMHFYGGFVSPLKVKLFSCSPRSRLFALLRETLTFWRLLRLLGESGTKAETTGPYMSMGFWYES